MAAGRTLLAALRVDTPGPILGWVTLRCRSVWPAVILHDANNLTYLLHA